jgi:predicted nucleic acid-binding protein
VNKYLLDTNVVSELRKRKPHGDVVSWVRSLRDDQVFLSAVTMGELQSGVELTRLQDPDRAAEIELWVDQLSDSYQVLAMDTRCFREWGRVMRGTSDELIEDGMIAATARVHGLIFDAKRARFQALRRPRVQPVQDEPITAGRCPSPKTIRLPEKRPATLMTFRRFVRLIRVFSTIRRIPYRI